jgi:NADH dehydrogenase
MQVVACVRSARGAATLPVSPGISPYVIDYDDREALASALTGAGCVVHLAGILMESPSTNYQDANVGATRAVVEACQRTGVGRIVLISALGADPDSANRYLRSKGLAERSVLASGIPAAIVRTPILLGPRTAGGRAVVHAASRRTVTLVGGGRHSIRPLDVDDLSRAILRCCHAPPAATGVYELVGPEAVTYRDVVARTAKLMGGTVSIRSMPVWLAKAGAAVAGVKRQGGMTPTVIEVITSNEAVEKNADVELGITLSPLSATLEKLLPSQAKV